MGRANDLFERFEKEGSIEVERHIREKIVEEIYLDYKVSADEGANSRLHNNDRANLAKAISGFGNSEGGVIVWGVRCRNEGALGDVPSEPQPVTNPGRFQSWLEQAISGLTIPPHEGVRHIALPIHGSNKGFVVTLVPEGRHPPYQTVPDLRYLIRAGSSFVPTPHAVLAALFGRKPSPKIIPQYVSAPPTLGPDREIQLQIGFLLTNIGLGIATDIFMNLAIIENGGDANKINFSPPDPTIWTGQFSFGQIFSAISRPEIRLQPEAHLMPFSVSFSLSPPFDRRLHIKGLCGGSGSVSIPMPLIIEIESLNSAYTVVNNTPPGAKLREGAARRIQDVLFTNIKSLKS